MMKNNKGLLLILDLVGFLCVIGSMFLLIGNPSTGNYEVNLYSAYPTIFWVLLSVALISGLSSGILSTSDETSYKWVFGFIIVVVINIIVLLQPYFRNYAFTTQWDDVNHFSESRNIYDLGHPYKENFYPASHVLLASFSLLSGINLQTCLIIFPTIFYGIYILNVGALAWTIDRRPGARGIMLLASSPLMYNVFSTVFRPTHFAVMLFPLVVLWVVRAKLLKIGWQEFVPFLLILFFLPFLHPWGVIATLVFLVCIIIATMFEKKEKINLLHIVGAYRQTQVSTSILILFISWWTWFTSHQIFGSSFRRIVNSFNEALSGSYSLVGYLARAEKANLSLSQILSLITFTYGPILIYLLLGLFSIWILYKRIKNRIFPNRLQTSISLFTFIFLIVAFVSVFRDLITEGPFRITNFVLVVLPVLIVGAFFSPHNSGRDFIFRSKKIQNRGFLVILISGSAVLGIFNSYYSPITGQPNHQFSYSEQVGMRFLIDFAVDDDSSISSPFGGGFTLSSVVRSSELARLREESPRWWIQVAPDRFDYSGYPELGFGKPGYLIIAAPEKAYYTLVWPEGGRITAGDFLQLPQNSFWSRIYDSGDLTILRSDFR